MKALKSNVDLVLLALILLSFAKPFFRTSPMNNTHQNTNELIHETSPYLLQHAHNPVNWKPWSEAAFELAAAQNKLVLVSIGYSACHWCHVMEHESFEDSATAAIMNEHFICIKVDREERPEVDQIYMSAVQLMTGQGGWPLNCFTLPDKRPLFGGTYFPNEKWKQVLLQLSNLYTNDSAKAIQYATELSTGLIDSEVIKINQNESPFVKSDLQTAFETMQKSFDGIEGGPNRSPKFPMPSTFRFLLGYYYHSNEKAALDHTLLSLRKMAMGGIYDQVGGGFSRYSTDVLWKVPHFEKMLYDNAQLVSIYSDAFKLIPDPLFKETVFETLEFISREMTSKEGAFYSALDADSEGEEGKFYVWSKLELEKNLGEDFAFASDYYNVNSLGFWEHGNYILLRKKSLVEVAALHSLSNEKALKKVNNIKHILLEARTKRVRPGLDDKILASWNGLMIKGYADAYATFDEKKFLDAARANANFILENMSMKDGGLFHTWKNGQAKIPGFLEDYSAVISGLIRLYEVSFDEKYVNEAKRLTDYVIAHFYDSESGFCFFTSDLEPVIIVRSKETQDNVIPSSNSMMADNFFWLSHFFEDSKYFEISKRMINNVKEEIQTASPWYSNWAALSLNLAHPFHEVIIAGENYQSLSSALSKKYLPNVLIGGGQHSKSNFPLLKDRVIKGKTWVYVCKNQTCQLPVKSIEEALLQIEK